MEQRYRPPELATEDPARTILVVENEAENRELMEQILLLGGYHAVPAADGLKALRVLDAAPVDLVLLDLSMPLLDGYRTAQLIRSRAGCSSLPVVAVSGHTQSEALEHALRAGFTAFLTKPFRPRELLRIVDSLLRITPRAEDA